MHLRASSQVGAWWARAATMALMRPGIEFVTSLFCPLRGEVGPGCVDGLGDVPEVAFGVEDVDDLDRIGETLVGEGPDPGCAVAEDDPAVGIGETAAFGFAAHALGEGWKWQAEKGPPWPREKGPPKFLSIRQSMTSFPGDCSEVARISRTG